MRAAAAAAGFVTLFAIVGCGSTSTSGSQGTSTNTESLKDPSEILNDAVVAMNALSTYRVVFSGKDAIGTISFDLSVDGKHQSATGTMVQSGVAGLVTVTGSTLYVQQQALAEALLQRSFGVTVTGWVRIQVSTIPNLATLLNPSYLAQCANDDAGNVSAGSQSKIAGVETLALNLDSENNNSNVLNVALEGKTNVEQWTIQQADTAEPSCTGGTQVDASTDSSHPTSLIGTLTFSNFGKSVAVSTPAPATDAPPIESGY